MANLKDVIYLSNEDYETLVTTGTVTIDGTTLTYDENCVYITPDKLASSSEDGLMSASDKSKLDGIAPGATANVGTVTSVRVQATSPVVSSTSSAQTSTLNTTISLANGYGDTKNPYASKTANYVLASPNGSAGVPSFRSLVAADIPDGFVRDIGTVNSSDVISTTFPSNQWCTFTSYDGGGRYFAYKSGSNLTIWSTYDYYYNGYTSSDTYGAWKSGTTSKTYALTTDIPTVNNGGLTIQKNGTIVQTFHANQSSNATANISVPTLTTTTGSESISEGTSTLNVVTRNTAQTISGTKTFSAAPVLNNNLSLKGKDTNGTDNRLIGISSSNNVCINWDNSAGTYTGGSVFSPLQANSGVSTLGDSTHLWKNLYLSGNLTDGTNSITIANIQKKLPTTTTAGKVLKSTSTAGTVQWADDNNTNYYPIRSYTSGLKISTYSGSQNCELYVPEAGSSQSGVVTTGNQGFSGAKTFSYYGEDFSPINISFDNSQNYFLIVEDTDSGYTAQVDFGDTSSWSDITLSIPGRSGIIGLQVDIVDLTSL